MLDPERREAIDAALGELGDHVARRIEHDEPVALGGDPEAAFALVAAPGHGFSDKRTGDAIAAIPRRCRRQTWRIQGRQPTPRS